MCLKKCQLYMDAVKRIQDADDVVTINFLITDLETLLEMARKKREKLEAKSDFEAIRKRLDHINPYPSEGEALRRKDALALLKIIEEKIPEYAPPEMAKAVSDV